uniref:Uncharacterized protein n=1 Tax=Cacopsylla melanoneura TaxID=428564 RepID=A0A8D8SUG8_9HEMI
MSTTEDQQNINNMMETKQLSMQRILQSKNSAEGENGFSIFNSGGTTESSSGFDGFNFSEDLKAINDEAESQQDEITTKKTTKVTISTSKSTDSKPNKSSESKDKEKDKPVTAKPKSKSSKTKQNSKKEDSKSFNFDTNSRIKHDDFEFDENLIPRFRRQNKNSTTTEAPSNEIDKD